MRVVSGTPPNFDAIIAVFPDARRKGVVFTYGETVYVNGEPTLPVQLERHEGVHIVQQRAVGVETWWRRYLTDARFRYKEELAAHRAEYRTLKRISNNLAKKHLHFIAQRLASPLYGSVVTLQQARKAIKAP